MSKLSLRWVNGDAAAMVAENLDDADPAARIAVGLKDIAVVARTTWQRDSCRRPPAS